MTNVLRRPASLWENAPLLLLLGSGGLLLGALFFQYALALPPCPLCHWQRYPHIAAVAVALGTLAIGPGALRPWLLAGIGLALLTTAGIGIFHAGVEQKWWEGLAVCEGTGGGPVGADDLDAALGRQPPPRCDQIAWSFLGLSMAAWNAILSLALAAIAFRAAAARTAPR